MMADGLKSCVLSMIGAAHGNGTFFGLLLVWYSSSWHVSFKSAFYLKGIKRFFFNLVAFANATSSYYRVCLYRGWDLVVHQLHGFAYSDRDLYSYSLAYHSPIFCY